MVATSARFAEKNETQLLLLAEVAQEFGQDPASLLRFPSYDMQINVACAVVLWRERERIEERIRNQNG